MQADNRQDLRMDGVGESSSPTSRSWMGAYNNQCQIVVERHQFAKVTHAPMQKNHSKPKERRNLGSCLKKKAKLLNPTFTMSILVNKRGVAIIYFVATKKVWWWKDLKPERKATCVSRENNHHYLHSLNEQPNEQSAVGKKARSPSRVWHHQTHAVFSCLSNDARMHNLRLPCCANSRPQIWVDAYARYSKTRDRQVIVAALGFKFDHVVGCRRFCVRCKAHQNGSNNH